MRKVEDDKNNENRNINDKEKKAECKDSNMDGVDEEQIPKPSEIYGVEHLLRMLCEFFTILFFPFFPSLFFSFPFLFCAFLPIPLILLLHLFSFADPSTFSPTVPLLNYSEKPILKNRIYLFCFRYASQVTVSATRAATRER